MIPRILHRTVPEIVPPPFESYWDRFIELHTDWEACTYQDPLYPEDWELGRLFARCKTGAQLAGLVRLEAVWRWGGVYVDMDMEPIRPFDDLLDNECFIGTEDGTVLTDAVFGAVPGHPGLRACMDELLSGWWSDNPSETGPLLTTRFLTRRHDVTVLPIEAFYPYSWTEKHRADERFDGSYAVHRWNYSWAGWQA